jgi:uncharacterized protein
MKRYVIGAGSLLEFALEEERFSYPTGRVQFMQLGPLSFREYMLALNQDQLLSELTKVTLERPLSQVIHNHLLEFVREYFFIGGMPAILSKH